jgi:phage tail-like protein
MIPKKSKLTSWIDSTLGGGLIKAIKPVTITLKLLGANKSPVVTWTFANAYPVKWSVSDFNAMENNLSVETLEFAYTYFKRKEN